MSVIPFLPGLFYALEAYNSTCSKMPVFEYFEGIEGLIKERTVYFYKGSKKYDEIVKTLPGYNTGQKIKNELQPFFDRIGMRKDFIIIEKVDSSLGSAVGSNFFTESDVVIFVSPGLWDIDKDACRWVIKHEAGHIKNNDLFMGNLVPAIFSTVAAISSKAFSIPVIPAFFFTAGVTIVTDKIFSQYCEGKADDLAIKEGSPEELKAARGALMSFKASNLESRNTRKKKIRISPDGEDRLCFSHPSHGSRLKKVESALRRRNIKIDHQEESEKVEKLTVFMNKFNEKIKDEKID